MSLINGLNIGKRAIMAHMQAIQVAGRNISNISTPGYSRQEIKPKDAIYSAGSTMDMVDVRRVRDRFIDHNIRTENQSLGQSEMRSQLYGQIENVFLEPSQHGLNSLLAEFWNSWEDLANAPESAPPRSVIVQRGIVLTQSINRIDAQLKDIQKTADGYIRDRVVQINDMASQIAHLNARIVSVESSGKEASEIRDSRDLLIDQMSKLVDTAVVERDTGSIAVFIGGRAIVDDAEVTALETQQFSNGNMLVTDVVWSNDDASANIPGGEIAGLLDIRDEVIPEMLTGIDQLASTLASEVNTIHSTGYGLDGSTGVNFFTGTGAADIQISDEVMDDVRQVAASQNSEPGENSIALAIAALADEGVAPDGTSIGMFYSNIVSSIGAQSHSASMMVENAEILVAYLEEQRDSVSGVSLDEETANLIGYQRAYESAAHYVSVIDELIGVLMDIV